MPPNLLTASHLSKSLSTASFLTNAAELALLSNHTPASVACMAAPSSRLERLVKVLGEENLPSKLPQADATNERTSGEGESKETPNEPETAKNTTHEEDWWNAKPQLVQVQPFSSNQQTSKMLPVITNNGDISFPFEDRVGEPAFLGLNFCPLLAVAKFPYKFVPKKLLQPIASAFFDEGKIWERGWEVYYIWSDHFDTGKAITFVPEHQLLALIDEINEAFPDAKLAIDDYLREQGLVLNFDDIERVDLRPRWLGRSTSKDQHDDWVANLPQPTQIGGSMPSNNPELEAFKEKMELANEVARNKSKAANAKRRGEHLVKRQNMSRSLLRAQRYLGLLPKNKESVLPDVTALSISPLDCDVPAPHPFDQDVIFVSVDVEAYERPPRMVTEIGIAMLDTRDLKESNQAPAGYGEGWQQHIRARHFRIAEYKSYINSDFVQGCPANFDFGSSEFFGNDSIGREIAKCFRPPYGNVTAPPTPNGGEEKRNIVLLGHDISQDITYLQKIGVNVLNSGSIIDKVDTAEMYCVYTHDPNPKSLGNILYDFDLVAWHLHNAGNDAVYTVWAMLAVCVQAATERGTDAASARQVDRLEERTDAAVERAREQVKDGVEGWELCVGDDGGVPVVQEEKAVFGPPRPNGQGGGDQQQQQKLYTMGGAVLDV